MNRLDVATAGLFAAWLAHDLEELATLSANSRALVTRLPDWFRWPRPSDKTQALQQTGVGDRRSLPAAIALFAGSLAGGHLAAYLVTKNQPSTRIVIG